MKDIIDIVLLDDENQEISLEINGMSVCIDVEEKWRDGKAAVFFNLNKEDHADALRTLVRHLQARLESHGIISNLRSEIKLIEEIISETPKENVIELNSMKARLEKVKQELERLEKP